MQLETIYCISSGSIIMFKCMVTTGIRIHLRAQLRGFGLTVSGWYYDYHFDQNNRGIKKLTECFSFTIVTNPQNLLAHITVR